MKNDIFLSNYDLKEMMDSFMICLFSTVRICFKTNKEETFYTYSKKK